MSKDNLTKIISKLDYNEESLKNSIEKINTLTIEGKKEIIESLSIAIATIRNLKKDLDMPKEIEVWNGQYSCPSCLTLLGNTSDCDDDFKSNTSNCPKCGQMIDWNNEKKENLSLLDLKRIVDAICKKTPNHMHPKDIPVLINLSEMSIGPGASEPVTGAYIGFDWEADQFRLYTKEKIIHEQLKRDNPRKSIERDKISWCPNCTCHVGKSDSYCKHCGQKLEKRA